VHGSAGLGTASLEFKYQKTINQLIYRQPATSVATMTTSAKRLSSWRFFREGVQAVHPGARRARSCCSRNVGAGEESAANQRVNTAAMRPARQTIQKTATATE